MIHFRLMKAKISILKEKPEKLAKKLIYREIKNRFLAISWTYITIFFILVSTNQKLSKLNIFSCFLRFYWRNRTVFTQIICEYFNRFNIVFHISHINRYLWPTKTPKIRRNIEIWFTFDFHKPKNLNRNINP